MERFNVPGIYCVRTEKPAELVLNTIPKWAQYSTLADIKGFCWLTSTADQTLVDELGPLIHHRGRRLKGLDVISMSNRPSVGQVRDLVKLLDSACPLRPGVVWIENLEQWLSDQGWAIFRMDSLQQIRFLSRWCEKRKVTIIGLIEKDLPVWSSFANGLADMDGNGEVLFCPWWQKDWGYSGSLWNSSPLPSIEKHYVVEPAHFKGVEELSRAIFNFRLHATEEFGLHVFTGQLPATLHAPALLLLGADTVFENHKDWERENGIDLKRCEALKPEMCKAEDGDSEFGLVLQEIFAPGQLKYLDSVSFANQCLMLANQTRDWGVHCTLTRLSILRHVSASQAARLTDNLNLNACGLATAEAVYLFRLWEEPPTPEQMEAWLEAAFSVPMASLFAGISHYQQLDALRTILESLHDYKAAVVAQDIEDNYMDNASALTDIWESETGQSAQRPWLARLSSLAGISHLTSGSRIDHMEHEDL